MKLLDRYVNKLKRYAEVKEIEMHLGEFTIVRRYGEPLTAGEPYWAIMHETYLYDAPTLLGALAEAVLEWQRPAHNVPHLVFASQFIFDEIEEFDFDDFIRSLREDD